MINRWTQKHNETWDANWTEEEYSLGSHANVPRYSGKERRRIPASDQLPRRINLRTAFRSPGFYCIRTTDNELASEKREEKDKDRRCKAIYVPFSSVMYVPRYSCRSVCSWLLMRMKRCPVRFARYSMMEVFPAEVGPCNKIGCLLRSTARAKFERCDLTLSVTT